MILDALQRIANQHESLSREEAHSIMAEILSGKCTDAQIAAFLVALHMKGETVEEIVGFAEAIRAAATPLHLRDFRGRSQRYRARRAGRYLRHRRRRQRNLQYLYRNGFCSRRRRGTGRQAWQPQLDLEVRFSRCDGGSRGEHRFVPNRLAACLEKFGIAFLFAPTMHSAMKHVQAARRELRLRTVFNLLGPLTNPADASAQVVGVYSVELVEKLAEALSMLGLRRAHGCPRTRRAGRNYHHRTHAHCRSKRRQRTIPTK